MLQRKNGDREEYKRNKMSWGRDTKETKRPLDSPDSHDSRDSRDSRDSHDKPAATKISKLDSSSPDMSTSKSSKYKIASNTNTPAKSASSFKSLRSKRKAHLQTRDLKRKLKKFDAHRDLAQHNSISRRDVRDVVQEPPKLHGPKKTFKKVLGAEEEIKSWSDIDDDDDDQNDS